MLHCIKSLFNLKHFTILLYWTGELKICIILTHVLVSFIDRHTTNQLRNPKAKTAQSTEMDAFVKAKQTFRLTVSIISFIN